ncbi:MAG: hypothetical protein V4709_02660 [Pseudomonadota bacterium]
MHRFQLSEVNKKITVVGVLLACFMLRPTAGGQTLTPIALILLLAFLLFDFINRRPHIQKPSAHSTCVALIGIFLWIYLALHGIFSESERIDFVVKSTVAHVITIACVYLIFSDSQSSYRFFKYLSAFLMLPIVSYMVTALLGYLFSFDALYLFSMNIEEYPGTGDILFPITPVYTFVELPGVKLIRLSGFFRESGIAQAFYGWGFMSAPFLWRRAGLVRFLFAAGMIFSISTVGIFLLALLIVGISFLSLGELRGSPMHRLARVAFVAALAGIVGFTTYYVSENVPVVGLRDKEERSVSADDRYDASSKSLLTISDYPLGLGLYSNTGPNSTINLIGSIGEIGVLGFILVLSLYFVPPLLLRRHFYAAACVLPVFLTAVTSQPLLDAPFVYILLFFAPKNIGAVNKTYKKSDDKPLFINSHLQAD